MLVQTTPAYATVFGGLVILSRLKDRDTVSTRTAKKFFSHLLVQQEGKK
jgi:hypothetical protein